MIILFFKTLNVVFLVTETYFQYMMSILAVYMLISMLGYDTRDGASISF
jgi:hypothetical protein